MNDRVEGAGVIIVGTGTANLIGRWKARLDAQRTNTPSPRPASDPPPIRKPT
jgi:hypothetical protein